MKIHQKAINSLRVISAEMISNAELGDTQLCFVATPIMFALFKDHYNYYGGVDNINRDRFVLCDPKLSPLYYSLQYVFNFGLGLSTLKSFGTSVLPYCPNTEKCVGVDVNTGQKGQALASAVGLAIAECNLANKFNAQKFHIISNNTYCIATSSCLDEGVSWEALSLAGELKLNKLILIVIEDKCCKISTLDTKKRFLSMGWNVETIKHFNNYFISTYKLTKAKLSLKPTVIIVKTDIANPKNKIIINRKILFSHEVEKLKADFGFNGSYKIPNDVKQLCMRTERRLKVEYSKWERKAVLYKNTHPQLSTELNEYYDKPKLNFNSIIKSKPEKITNSIEINQTLMNAITYERHCYMSGSNEREVLELTKIQGGHNFSRRNYRGKNILFGYREQSMAIIIAGISLYFNAPTYCSAKLSYVSNMLYSIKYAVSMNLPVQFIFIKDTDDGIAELQGIKGLTVYEPKNTSELVASHSLMYETEKPSALILTNDKISGEISGVNQIKKELAKKK